MAFELNVVADLAGALREGPPLLQILIGPRQVGKTTAAWDLAKRLDWPFVFEAADLSPPPGPEWIETHWQRARALGGRPALLVLELLSKEGRPLSELVGDLRSKYFISGEINSTVDDGDAKMKEIEAAHPDAEISWLDGVSVDYDDWHFNVRPSNTEPLLRLNLESLVSKEDMESKRDAMLEFIRS